MSVNTSPTPSWPDYRAVWRWHFYASLFCMPFVLVLAASGSLYLFKPQIEAWIDRPYDNLQFEGQPASASEQVRAAVAAFPDSTPSSYELPATANDAARVVVRQGGESLRVYVHPQSLAVLHSVPENERFMRQLFRLHGELWMGDRGSNLVELAASWTIIMLVTGLYLWWPRKAKGLGGVLYPRLRGGFFWRDLHAVTGVWISGLALFLLLSGLPWAKFWGNYFRTVRQLTSTAVVQQDWSTGSERAPRSSAGGEHGGHSGGSRSSGGRRRGGGSAMPKDLAALDRVAAAVRPLNLPPPVFIAPPTGGSDNWTAKSMTANRPFRVNLVVNGATGEIVSRDGFAERSFLDKVVAVGIAAHEGQLFGWPNQLLGLLTALGLMLLCVSGLVLWWRRRDSGVLGAPKVLLSPRVSLALIALVVLFGLYLPLFGASLLLVLVVEWGLLRRIPRVRDWLGLQVPRTAAAGLAALLLLMVIAPGCGPRPIVGGTKGLLRTAGKPLSDVQVTVHEVQSGATSPIGFGVTTTDGTFELVTNGAKGPLRLAPGEYRCTLESAGAPVKIPKAYAQPDTTPLKVSWSSENARLDLEVSVPLIR